MFRILLWCCCAAITIPMTAQVPLYPVHQQEKWGFISVWGGKPELTIPPTYDHLSINLPWHSLNYGSGESPFRLFEQGKKVGLLDDGLQEALPASYQYIFPLTRHYFAVRTDSMFRLVRPKGVLVLQEQFDDIFALGIDSTREIQYIVIVKNQLRGVFSVPEDRVLFEPKFDHLELVHESGFFKIRDPNAKDQNQAWGIADKNGKIVLPCRYVDVNLLHPRLFAVKVLVTIPKDSLHDALVVDKWKIVADGVEKEEQYDQIQRMNSHWAVAIRRGEAPSAVLWSLDSIKTVGHPYKTLKPLDENYLIGIPSYSSRQQLLKNDLSPAVDTNYSRIEPAGFPGIYRVERRDKWGLIVPAQSREPMLPLVYDWIKDFKDSIVLVSKNRRWGAANFKLDTIVPCMFYTLEQVSPRVLNGQLDEDGNFKIIALDRFFNFQKATTLQKGIESVTILDDQSWFEAMPRYTSELSKTSPTEDLYWPDWQDFSEDVSNFSYAKSTRYAFPMVTDKMVGVIFKNQKIKIPYAPNFKENKVFGMMMYGLDGKRIAGSPAMVGCMPFKVRVPYTVFIDTLGLMGLVDRQGLQRCDSLGQPLRFTYIGPFNCGLANVCVGGQLVFQKVTDEKVFSLGISGAFQRLFGWQGANTGLFTQDYHYFVAANQGNQPRWGVIDLLGRFVVPPTFDFINHYYLPDSLAKVGKYGVKPSDPLVFSLMDTKGKLLFPPKYQSIERYKKYFITENRGAPKYIFDTRGAFVMRLDTLPQGYRNGFAEGRSAELDSNGRYGYIDTLGHFVLPGQYTTARNFSEGLAAVCVDSLAYWCFIDRSGKLVFKTAVPKSQGNWLGNFKGNRCYFREKANAKYGYYNRQGEPIIKPAFKSTGNFSNGVAVVTSVDKQAKLEIPGIIDSTGHVLLKTSMLYQTIAPFNLTGTTVAKVRDTRKYVMLNSVGEPVTPPYDSITNLLNGFAKVRSNKQWGLVDGRGNLRLPIEFLEIDTVSEGMVAVQKEKRGYWAYFDTAGRRLPVENLIEAQVFKNGYAKVYARDTSTNSQGGQQVLLHWLLLDRQGNILPMAGGVPTYWAEDVFVRSTGNAKTFTDKEGLDLLQRQFGEIQPVNPDLFIVRNFDKAWGAVNRRGMTIIPMLYNRVLSRRWYLQAVNPKLRGLVSRDGRELLPPEYEEVEEMTNGIFQVTRGGEIGYYDLKTGWIWPLQK